MKKQHELTISIAYPNPGSVKSVYHDSIVGMILYECTKVKDEDLQDQLIVDTKHLGSFLFQTPGCYVSINRAKIVDEFLRLSQDDYLLMIDPDIAFERDILDKIVGHLLAFRETIGEIHILAGRVNINNGYPVFFHDQFGGLVQQVQPFYGVKEFDSVGTGIIAISRECLKFMVEKEKTSALFRHEFLPSRRELGDDHSFCRLAKSYGYKIYGAWNIVGRHLKERFVESRYPETLESVAPGFAAETTSIK